LGESDPLREMEVCQEAWELILGIRLKMKDWLLGIGVIPENSSQREENAVPRIFCHWLADMGISPFTTAEKTVFK
jgi:hypothetical protein